jgi:uncharacterized protein
MLHNPTPIFIRYLRQLAQILEKIAQREQQNPAILGARLTADMLPLIQQVRATANFSLRACCPLAGVPLVLFNNPERSFNGLQQQIQQTIDYLAAIPPEQFAQLEQAPLPEKAGFADLSLPPEAFLFEYTLPNFFFHLSMVYAVARSRGVALSKGDFDGYHAYPPGFSFEK